MTKESSSGQGSVIVSVPLGLLMAVMVIAVTSQGRDTGAGTVDVGTVWLVQGLFGGGSVLCFLLGTVMGWREAGGHRSAVPAYVLPTAGVALAALWLFSSVGAYGS